MNIILDEVHIVERIRRLRACLLVHSYIYYRLNTSLISDEVWDGWAQELIYWQVSGNSDIGFYDAEFEGWDGTSGFYLPQDSWVVDKSTRLLIHHEKMEKLNDK